MEQHRLSPLEQRLFHLERRLRAYEVSVLLLALVLTAVLFGMTGTTLVAQGRTGEVLRVRGLVIEDAHGRPRILLGAPAPKVAERKRQDDVTGLLLLGENGADRIAVAYPGPDPQIGGKVVKRIAPEAGITMNDPEGNERAGFGAFDDGRVVLGLDYSDREAVSLAVLPEAGFAGLIIHAESGSPSERAQVGVFKNGVSLLKLSDTSGMERAMILVSPNAAAKLLGINAKDKETLEVEVVRLNPYERKSLTVSPQTFWAELDKIKP